MEQITQEIIFDGTDGINSDQNEKAVKSGDSRYRLNCRSAEVVASILNVTEDVEIENTLTGPDIASLLATHTPALSDGLKLIVHESVPAVIPVTLNAVLVPVIVPPAHVPKDGVLGGADAEHAVTPPFVL